MYPPLDTPTISLSIDVFARYTWIYLLKSKTEALTAFKQFKASTENQFNLKIKSIQIDWGGEFKSYISLLLESGINHRIICPHTHHQNGMVERKHGHIVELGLTLLAMASLPYKFCNHAFLTTVYLIINRLPTAALIFQILYSIYITKLEIVIS